MLHNNTVGGVRDKLRVLWSQQTSTNCKYSIGCIATAKILYTASDTLAFHQVCTDSQRQAPAEDLLIDRNAGITFCLNCADSKGGKSVRKT